MTTRSTRAVEVGQRGRRRRRGARSPGRPVAATLRCSQTSAAASRSTACTTAPGCSSATARASAPQPVHRSTTTGAREPAQQARGADLGDRLGLGPGHEDARAHRQAEPAETGRAEQVLQRLAGRPTRQQPLEGRPRRAEVVGRSSRPAGSPEHVRGQRPGVVGGRGHPGGGQQRGGRPQVGGQRPPRRRHCSVSPSCSAASACTRESITASRSPESTASRLCAL